MKVVRAIKIVLLIVAILCLLCTAVGNYFVLKDACDYKITADEVREAFDKYSFSFGNLFKAKAEGDVPPQETDNEQPVDNTQVQNDAEETADEPETAEPETVVDDGSYKAGNHLGLLSSVMKLSSGRIHLSFLDDLSFNLCKVGKIGIRGEEAEETTPDPENPEATITTVKTVPAFEVNTVLAIGFVALTLAFILHLFSKKRRKTIWSIIVMIFGYLLLTAFFAGGQVLANLDINPILSESAQITDVTAYRIYAVAGMFALGVLVSFGYLRCGARAMKRIRKKTQKR